MTKVRMCLALIAFLFVTLSISSFAASDQSILTLLRNAFRKLERIEPNREGPIHDGIRANVLIVNPLNPSIKIVFPANGQVLPAAEKIIITADIQNWLVDADEAVPAGTHFANGHHEHQTGHAHIWIYDRVTGNRVKFNGANSFAPSGIETLHDSAGIELPPGEYKLYVALQNHDHTPAIQSSAQSLPAFDAVVFSVE